MDLQFPQHHAALDQHGMLPSARAQRSDVPTDGNPPVRPEATRRGTTPPGARRSKAEALSIAQRLKRGIAIGGFIAFGTLSLAVAGRVSAANTTQSSTTSTSTTAPSSTSTSSGSFFFQQAGGSNVGSTGSSSSSSASSAPVSGSSVS